MIRSLFATGVSALALTLATPVLAQDDVPHGDAAKPATEPALPTMSFGTWGFDPEAISPEIKPGDDFFA